MCGIAGLAGSAGSHSCERIARGMADALLHRGPDDGGVWADEAAGVALGHRRLSVLDLSPAGHQPMQSACGRYVVAFNGEIYNHLEIRSRLQAEGQPTPEWRGHSDTETLLVAFAAWGVEKTLQACVGMFAIALWDRQERTLTLARDRIGEKPLYYGRCGNAFAFASELKAIRRHPEFDNEVSREALCLYLRHGYVPAPYSIYRDIHKLPAGCLLRLPMGSHASPVSRQQSLPEPVPYWSLSEVVERGQAEPFPGSDDEALAGLETRLRESIGLQSIADVPLGAFLSGGVDSSLIVALMQEQGAMPVRTFSIGFHEKGHNEAEYARAVADHLQTEHAELYVSDRQAMEVIPQLPWLYDEPFADSSQIPTFLVARMARRQVTVALSGDAGDELFGGYNRYCRAPGIWNKVAWLPYGVRQALSHAMIRISNQGAIARLGNRRVALPAEKLQKLGQRLESVKSLDEFYYSLVSECRNPEAVVIGTEEPQTLLTRPDDWPDLQPAELRMMYLDTMSYLPDDILCKVDRAAMGVSLETRVPFLDHRVVEFAWRMPLHMKIRNGEGKWALRQILYKHVPQALIERPKQGFAIPLAEWLRGPLRDWAEELLDEKRLAREGFFQAGPIREKWKEHLAGKRDWQHLLWAVLMFQAWLEANA